MRKILSLLYLISLSALAVPTQPTIGTIAEVDAAAVAEPYLPGSTVMHYCDCQTGNAIQPAAGCVAGSDTSGDGSVAHPFRSLGYPAFSSSTDYGVGDRVSYIDGDYESTASSNQGHYPSGGSSYWQYINPSQPALTATTWLSSRTSGNNTVALCQGGVWNAPSQHFSLVLNRNTYCPDGQTCSEFREYPVGGSGSKPVIYAYDDASSDLFLLGNGQRIMNLKLVSARNGGVSALDAFFLYKGSAHAPGSGLHDDTIWNVDIDGFQLAIQDATPFNYHMTYKGNHITNSVSMGFLGSSDNMNLNYNSFYNNGSDNKFDHTIYIGGDIPTSGVNVVGNYIYGFSTTSGQSGGACQGGPVIFHGEHSNVVISGNLVIEDANAAPGCWGIAVNHGGYSVGGYLRNALISDNIIVNGGNLGLSIDNCPHCVIENNLIIQDSPTNGGTGIAVPAFGAARTLDSTTTPACNTTAVAEGATCQDDPSTDYTIRNNTIYYTANAQNGMRAGILLGVAGSSETQTGHRVYNNTVVYEATSHGINWISCFSYPLPVSDYALINNNNCYSADNAFHWEATQGPPPTYTITAYSLPEWIAYAAANGVHFDDAKPAAITAADPGFVLADAPYINWSDGALAYDLFNDGANNVFAPSGPPLTANALTGPASDIRGIARPNPPSIGAYDVVAAAMGGVHDVPVLGPWALAALFGLLGLGGSLAVSRRRQD